MEDEIEDLKISKAPLNKFEDSNFLKVFGEEFSSGKTWRSAKSLAEKMQVPTEEMEAFLKRQLSVCCRPGKEANVFYYALIDQIRSKAPIPADKPTVVEEHHYALASLHGALILYQAALEKYALKICEKSQDALTKLINGKDCLEAGISLFSTKVKADVTKLPKV